ncbi:uncharacterized protein LOC135499390 [Lineus longissimus]|uniref:uncharacterized protein LOC135499390 n=1 Tax=Lineus longissimus TaxID=88925 RepID=UPI00315C75E1
MCEFNSNLTQAQLGSRCRHLKMPKLPDFVQCRYDDMCMGLECCLNVDYKLLKKPMKVWSIVDSCSNKVSAGLETYQYNVTLDASFWDRENLMEISEFVRAFFSVSKDDSTAMLEYVLVLSIYLDDDNTYPMLDKFKMPMPECNADFNLGTDLSSFVSSFPASAMVGATDDILRRLRLPSSFFDRSACPVADNYVQQSHANCPDFVFPAMPEGFRCKLNSDCLTLDCCATMHFFDKMEYAFKASFEIMPCTYEVKISVETDEVTRNIFDSFGSVWSKSYGNTLQVMYNFKKGIPGQFIIDFGLQYCMDGMCSDPLYFMHDTIMTVPLCQSGAMSWPSVDVQAAMISYAGDAAEKILALQNNLLRDGLTCDLSVSTTSCPHFELPSMPENYRCAYNRECTGFDCCIDMDMKISSRTFAFRVLLDPCKLSFHVGFEKWEFNGTLKGYSWGMCMICLFH